MVLLDGRDGDHVFDGLFRCKDCLFQWGTGFFGEREGGLKIRGAFRAMDEGLDLARFIGLLLGDRGLDFLESGQQGIGVKILREVDALLQLAGAVGPALLAPGDGVVRGLGRGHAEDEAKRAGTNDGSSRACRTPGRAAF